MENEKMSLADLASVKPEKKSETETMFDEPRRVVNSAPNTPKIVRWVIARSRGHIKTTRQASFVLWIFVVLALFTSYLLVSNDNDTASEHPYPVGFTLIELMVVIAIISLLASIVLVGMGSSRARARDAKRNHNLHQVKLALELYFSDNNKYPSIGPADTVFNWTGLAGPLATYMPLGIPTDPSGFIVSYVADANPSSIYAILVTYELPSRSCRVGMGMKPTWFGGPPANC
jgi:prepilin-type N-terminal cleavage/methylation domain-containing protein